MLTSENISGGLHTRMEMYIMRSNFQFLFASHTCFLITGNGYSSSEFNYILRSEALCLLHEGKELKKPIKPKFDSCDWQVSLEKMAKCVKKTHDTDLPSGSNPCFLTLLALSFS